MKKSWQPLTYYGIVVYMAKWTHDREMFLKHLKDRRLELGLTMEGVSTQLGKSFSYIAQVERGRGFPSLEVLARLAKIYKEDVRDYIAIRTGERKKDESLDSLVGLLVSDPAVKYDLDMRPVPVINLTNCGDWDDFTDKDYPVGIADEYHMAQTKDENAFYVRAEGDSMEPEIRHGDLVLIEPGQRPENGDLVFSRGDDGCAIKKLFITDDGRVLLLSLNTAYPPIAIRNKRGFKCFRVGGWFRKR